MTKHYIVGLQEFLEKKLTFKDNFIYFTIMIGYFSLIVLFGVLQLFIGFDNQNLLQIALSLILIISTIIVAIYFQYYYGPSFVLKKQIEYRNNYLEDSILLIYPLEKYHGEKIQITHNLSRRVTLHLNIEILIDNLLTSSQNEGKNIIVRFVDCSLKNQIVDNRNTDYLVYYSLSSGYFKVTEVLEQITHEKKEEIFMKYGDSIVFESYIKKIIDNFQINKRQILHLLKNYPILNDYISLTHKKNTLCIVKPFLSKYYSIYTNNNGVKSNLKKFTNENEAYKYLWEQFGGNKKFNEIK